MKQVCVITGLSRSSVYRLVAAKQFPQPVQLGSHMIAWHEHEVEAWAAGRPRIQA